jgi:EAL domain-containing protein (putative c-di-GMP-specific phosphodiesterase class I)/sensor domain CHASE-containing protein
VRIRPALRTVAAACGTVAGAFATALLLAWLGAAAAQPAPSTTADTQPAARALNALRRAWSEELEELTATARGYAVADDTYAFVLQPNIPYVYTHYARERLAAERIDTVLIVNRQHKPLLWRRPGDRYHRGFPDAQAFLARLPPLPDPGARGEASLAGAVRLATGPTLVVAMPIYAASGAGSARGWLIVARALNAAQWLRYEEMAHVEADVLDPLTQEAPGDVEGALKAPLTPVVRVEPTEIRGLLAVADLKGRPLRVFSIRLPRPVDTVDPVIPATGGRSPVPLEFAGATAAVGGGLLLLLWVRRRRTADPPARRGAAASAVPKPAVAPSAGVRSLPESERGPGDAVGVAPADATRQQTAVEMSYFGAHEADLGVAPDAAAAEQEQLRVRFAAGNAMLCYQPQIDLQTGRVAAFESLLCVVESGAIRPAPELVTELEVIGLGIALTEYWLREVCAQRGRWLALNGQQLPIGIPVSQHSLEDPGFLPFVRRMLVEHELAPWLLELQVPESVLAASATARRAYIGAHEAGVSVAIDGFDAARSNLGVLTLVPAAKLRVDPALVREVCAGKPAAVLFDAAVAAARGLGIIVCATGVDTAELRSAMEQHGCQCGQGAALGPPARGEQVFELLRHSGVTAPSVPVLQPDDALELPARASG